MESYIRPGCIVLTIYLRQAETAWEEVSLLSNFYHFISSCFRTFRLMNLHPLFFAWQLSDDLGFSLMKLLDLSDDPLWTAGWIYVRVQNQLAFVFNG